MRATSKRSTRTRTSSLAPEETDRPQKRTRSASAVPSSPRLSTPLLRRESEAPNSSITSSKYAIKTPVASVLEDSQDIVSSPPSGLEKTAMGEEPVLAPLPTTTTGALSVDRPLAGTTTPSRRLERLKNGHASDSSSLTDLDEDSEAETEKLENSPQKRAPRIVEATGTVSAGGFMIKHALATVSTPGDGFDESVDENTHSRVSSSPGSPTPASKKRKRENALDVAAVTPTANTIDSKRSKGGSPDGDSSRPTSPAPPVKRKAKDIDDVQVNGIVPEPVKEKGSIEGDDRDNMDVDADNEQEGEDDDDNAQDEDEGDSENHERDSPEKGDDEITIADDEAIREGEREAAREALEQIEKDFAKLRDKLYEERAAEIDNEIRMVEEGTHPQLLAMLEPVNRRRDEQVALANAKFNYSVQTLYISTKATRAATCSQFNQEIRKLREKCLAEVSETWYQIQRERRASDTLVPEYTFKLPEKKSLRTQQRQAYNAEVAMLANIAKTIGFPAAPEVSGASPSELQADLEAMGISTRPPNPRLLRRQDTEPDFMHHHHHLPAWNPRPGSPPGAMHQGQQHTHHHHHHHITHHHHHVPQQLPPTAEPPFPRRPPGYPHQMTPQQQPIGRPPQEPSKETTSTPLPPSAVLRVPQQTPQALPRQHAQIPAQVFTGRELKYV